MTTGTNLQNGTCPECETSFSTPPMQAGETLACPECMLNLRVNAVIDGILSLEMVEIQLRDWGE